MSDSTVLVVGEDEWDDYHRISFSSGEVITVVLDGEQDDMKLRGYDADLVALTTDISEDIRQQVLEPMTANGGKIVEVY